MKISDFGNLMELSEDNLDLLQDAAPGAYLLGSLDDNDEFVVEYWGSAFFGNGLKGRLSDHVGEYDYFRYKMTIADSSAWKYECLAYHEYGIKETDNERHPKRPENETKESLPCPVVNCPL